MFYSPTDLIINLPALLGFRPENSLAVVAVHKGDLGAAMRVDLGEHVSEAIGQIATLAARYGADGAIAVIVDADHTEHDHQPLIDVLDAAFTVRNIRLLGVQVVDVIAEGGRWHCADGCGAEGVLPNPGATALAAAAVFDGRQVYDSRRELEAMIAHDAKAAQRLADALADTPSAATPRDAVETALMAARALGAGETLGDDRIVAAAAGLVDKRVRDMLLGVALTVDRGAAEALWVTTARLMPAPWRVEALVLLAFHSYAAGAGPLAGIALEEALRVDPTHRLAEMLDTALQAGIPPAQVRELAEVGHRMATEAGVELATRSQQTT
jgi:Domain of unknown function (DUF4192)